MNQEYVPLLLLMGLVFLVAVALPLASHLLGPNRPTKLKGMPYESGMPPLGSARERFSVKFYLVAMFFIVFDIETVFLIPWAVLFGSGGGTAAVGMGFLLLEMLVFLLILAAGLVYVWKRGALEWD